MLLEPVGCKAGAMLSLPPKGFGERRKADRKALQLPVALPITLGLMRLLHFLTRSPLRWALSLSVARGHRPTVERWLWQAEVSPMASNRGEVEVCNRGEVEGEGRA